MLPKIFVFFEINIHHTSSVCHSAISSDRPAVARARCILFCILFTIYNENINKKLYICRIIIDSCLAVYLIEHKLFIKQKM